MSGSDFVELVLGALPRLWRQVVLLMALAVMTIFHWYAPVIWFTQDVAAGLAETWLPIFQSVVERSVQ